MLADSTDTGWPLTSAAWYRGSMSSTMMILRFFFVSQGRRSADGAAFGSRRAYERETRKGVPAFSRRASGKTMGAKILEMSPWGDARAGGDVLPVVHLVGEVVLELNHGELLELVVRDVLVQRRREHGGDVVHAVRKHHAVALLGAFGLVLERAKICGGAVSGGGWSADLGKPHTLRTRRERWSRRGCAARVTRAPRRVPSGRAQARRFVSRARHAPAIWSTGCNPTSPWYGCMVDPMVRSNSLSPMAERTRVAERPSRCGAAFSRCDLVCDATAVLTRDRRVQTDSVPPSSLFY